MSQAAIRRSVAAFGRNDARLILRDPMLLLLLAMAFGIGLGCRYGLPAIDAALASQGILPNDTTELRFRDLFGVFSGFVGLWQGALMPGTVFGFLLLDEKEDNTLTALRVTPTPLRRYLGYRAAVPALLGFVFSLALVPLIGHAPVPAWQLVPLALGSCLTASLVTLALAAFAHDKVQGLAFTKFGGIAGLTILFGWVAPEPWQWLLGLFPPFLVNKAYWMALEQHSLWWVPLLLSSAAQLLLLRLLLKRFQRTL